MFPIDRMKPRLRERMRKMLASMGQDAADAKSRAACERLIAQKEFRDAGVVMIFLSIAGEVDTAPIARAAWEAGKKVVAPRVDWENRHMLVVEVRSLETGVLTNSRGLREPTGSEPCPAEEIDLIVTPALAFDRRGHRLGRGGGFYDRFLALENLRAGTCGLAFCEQLVEELPIHQNDKPVDMLVTDKEVLRFKQT